MKQCGHLEVYATPGIDFATGVDMPGEQKIICLRCFEQVVETDEGLAALSASPSAYTLPKEDANDAS